MNNKWKGLWLAGALGSLLLAGASLATFGQDGPPPPPDHGFGDIVGVEMDHPGHVVTGAPFSAQTSIETVETLADGTHIDRKSTGAVYRDSQGRTRREFTMPAIGPAAQSGSGTHTVVMVHDPVAKTHFVLEPDQKVARTIPRISFMVGRWDPTQLSLDRGTKAIEKAIRRTAPLNRLAPKPSMA